MQTPVMPLWCRPLATPRGYGVKRHGTMNQQLRRIRLGIPAGYICAQAETGQVAARQCAGEFPQSWPYGEFSTCTVTTSIP